MNYKEEEKQYQAHSNWRAHVSNYVEIKKQKNNNCSPEIYCKEQNINYDGFTAWRKYIKKEDEYVFYVSFATEYINRAERSLLLAKDNLDKPNICMPLIRDAIVAYAAPFTSNHGRLGQKLSLNESKNITISSDLKIIHKKIREHRDWVIGHCDIVARNPRVCWIGISIKGKGYYWEDYKTLMPDFEKLILSVQKNLREYNEKTFKSRDNCLGITNEPGHEDQDPGPPKKLY